MKAPGEESDFVLALELMLGDSRMHTYLPWLEFGAQLNHQGNAEQDFELVSCELAVLFEVTGSLMSIEQKAT